MVTINSLSRHRLCMGMKVFRAVEAIQISTCLLVKGTTHFKPRGLMHDWAPTLFIASYEICRFKDFSPSNRCDENTFFLRRHCQFEEADSRKRCVMQVLDNRSTFLLCPSTPQWDLICVSQDRTEPNWSWLCFTLSLFTSTSNRSSVIFTEHSNWAPRCTECCIQIQRLVILLSPISLIGF